MSDLKELAEMLKSEASTMRRESKVYFGGDVTEQARKRNKERQQYQIKQADKYDGWAEVIEQLSNSISKDELRGLVEDLSRMAEMEYPRMAMVAKLNKLIEGDKDQ